MSADLFKAFVGTQNNKEDSRESARSNSTELLVQSDLSKPADTWQTWPALPPAASRSSPLQEPQNLWQTDSSGRDVLFDASQLDGDHKSPNSDDDDFGDFEGVVTKGPDKSAPQIEPLSATLDLLDLDGAEFYSGGPSEDNKDQTRLPRSSSNFVPNASGARPTDPNRQVTIPLNEPDDDWGDFETIGKPADVNIDHARRREATKVSLPTIHRQPASTVPEPTGRINSAALNTASNLHKDSAFEEEPWDDFEDGEAEKVTLPYQSTKLSPQQNLIEPVVVMDSVQRYRPTNVPPPAVLLAWLPKVFSALAIQARQPGTDAPVGVAAVQAYRGTARIIAGRAARWKRDTILAQSMKIGVAGRSGGMKLTTLDKGEGRKEEQAAEDAIDSWTLFSHTLNAAITRAKAQKPPMALSAKLNARTVTGLDVVSATHICAVCGLRRNERVIGIDVNVSDTFGEFWIEHWGHKDCADIWYQFNEFLDQR